MKKLILILSTTLISSSFFSQKNEVVLQYGLNYSDNYVTATNSDFKESADFSRETYQAYFGGLVGLKYRRKINNIKLGIGVQHVTFSQQVEGLTFGDNVDPQTGFTSSNESYQYLNRFLDIPLTVYYTLGNNKIKGVIEGGLSNFFYLNTAGSFETRKIDSYKAYNLGVNLALGGRYDFNDKLMLELNTHYQQFITGLIKDKPNVQERPFGIGLTLGFGYKF